MIEDTTRPTNDEVESIIREAGEDGSWENDLKAARILAQGFIRLVVGCQKNGQVEMINKILTLAFEDEKRNSENLLTLDSGGN